MTHPKLELLGVTRRYKGSEIPAVDDLSLELAAGETLALLGPSGCGKSTTLNMIVGLETPDSGEILIDGRSVISQPAGRRNVGLVFQDYAVFTSMTVRQNLAFGLKVRGTDRAETARAVTEVAELLGMADRLDARARDLGGSELQRVAIGRTLVTRPALLLLDEPLSNLEAAARLAMRRELRRLQKEIGLTIVYVTHDQVEALSLADRIAVMSNGRLRQLGTPAGIMERPDHIFVAGFMGTPPMNLLSGTVRDGTFSSGTLHLPLPGVPDGRLTLGLRPEAIALVPDASGAVGRVVAVEPRGPEAVVGIAAGTARLSLLLATRDLPAPGQVVGLRPDPARIVLFDNDSGRRLPAMEVLG